MSLIITSIYKKLRHVFATPSQAEQNQGALGALAPTKFTNAHAHGNLVFHNRNVRHIAIWYRHGNIAV